MLCSESTAINFSASLTLYVSILKPLGTLCVNIYKYVFRLRYHYGIHIKRTRATGYAFNRNICLFFKQRNLKLCFLLI